VLVLVWECGFLCYGAGICEIYVLCVRVGLRMCVCGVCVCGVCVCVWCVCVCSVCGCVVCVCVCGVSGVMITVAHRNFSQCHNHHRYPTWTDLGSIPGSSVNGRLRKTKKKLHVRALFRNVSRHAHCYIRVNNFSLSSSACMLLQRG